MKKYECCKCTHDGATPCVIEWGDYPAPQYCPDSGNAADWCEVVELPALPMPTVKDSLTVPEWCKVGAWVYSAALRTEFARITGPGKTSETLLAVTAEGFECVVLVTEEAISYGATRPARVQPWTGEEAIGKSIKWTDNDDGGYHFAVITGVTSGGIVFLVGTRMRKVTLDELASDADIVQIDGTPCGILRVAEASK